jgi:hypothetical protein
MFRALYILCKYDQAGPKRQSEFSGAPALKRGALNAP